MLPLHFVESRVRQRLAGLRRPGLVFEEALEVQPGRDVLTFYIRWKASLFRRGYIAVHIDFTRQTVTTEPVLKGLDLRDEGMAWLDQLVGLIPAASRRRNDGPVNHPESA